MDLSPAQGAGESGGIWELLHESFTICDSVSEGFGRGSPDMIMLSIIAGTATVCMANRKCFGGKVCMVATSFAQWHTC